MSTSTSVKRARNQVQDSEDSSQSATSPDLTPTTKALRLSSSQPSAAPLFCTLPPTCHPPHNIPTALADSQELESHYAKYHAHVCEQNGCLAVFPNSRLLELHHTECHDTLALLRKERGEKIFACHVDTCARLFLDPKKRRLHLIQAHGFPKEYFFAVTNKGVGGLLKKWGEGASMLRGSWKAREGQANEDNENGMDLEEEKDSGSDDDTVEEMLLPETRKTALSQQDAGSALARTGEHLQEKPTHFKTARTHDDGLDMLTNSLDSLSLVPPSVRFGRGGRSGRVAREAQFGLKGGRNAQERHPQTGVDSKPTGLSKENVVNEQSSHADISINIDGALEALKSEAPSNSTKTVAHIDGTSGSHALVFGRGRSRGYRARGRGRGSAQGTYRGRG